MPYSFLLHVRSDQKLRQYKIHTLELLCRRLSELPFVLSRDVGYPENRVITNLLLLLGIRRNGILVRTSTHWLLPIGYRRLVGALLVLGLLASLSASLIETS